MFGLAGKRPLKFAGSWYEADPKKLAAQLDNFKVRAKAAVNPAQNPIIPGTVLAIVAPHAGYAFSGATAACSYLVPDAKKINRIILLGPSHYQGFPGAALSADKSFATVFGDIAVDTGAVATLKASGQFHELTDVHRQEHSLEMQLAFIKKEFSQAKIVPILVGRLDDAGEARLIALSIKRILMAGDLVVVSSDFTHFGPRYGYTPFKRDLAENVKKLDMEAFSYLEKNDLDGFFAFYKRTEDTICGVYALSVLLALLPDAARGHLFDYRTSRDSLVEDDQNSVSYLAIAFDGGKDSNGWGTSNQFEVQFLTDDDKKVLVQLARLGLEHVVKTGSEDPPDLKSLGIAISDRLKKPQGVFVTLFRKFDAAEARARAALEKGTSGAREGKELRGCIGYIMPVKPLYQAVLDNAAAAGTRDHRFSPVESNELSNIEIEISVLTKPQPVASAKDIRVGTDGVLLFCRGRQSVFLPHVATEFGWDLDDMLTQLALKAGLPARAWQTADARFEVFQAIEIDEKKLE
jgi:AmmeMemoRadiSam system protein B/AmmeMemoRadiSam system protein A